MRATVSFAALAVAALLVCASATFTDCSSSGSIASNLQVTITPSDPQPGQQYTYKSSYTLSKEVSGGKAHYQDYISGINVQDRTDDLCTDLAKTQTPCPLAAGKTISSTTTGTVPSDTPSGDLKLVTTWTNEAGEEIFCIQLEFQESLWANSTQA